MVHPGSSVNVQHNSGLQQINHASGRACRCAYSDLILALRRLRSASGGAVRKCLIVDLDVHQVGYK